MYAAYRGLALYNLLEFRVRENPKSEVPLVPFLIKTKNLIVYIKEEKVTARQPPTIFVLFSEMKFFKSSIKKIKESLFRNEIF